MEQFGNIEDYLPDPEYEELKNGGPQVYPRGPPPSSSGPGSSGPGPSGPSEHSGVFSISFHNFFKTKILMFRLKNWEASSL